MSGMEIGLLARFVIAGPVGRLDRTDGLGQDTTRRGLDRAAKRSLQIR